MPPSLPPRVALASCADLLRAPSPLSKYASSSHRDEAELYAALAATSTPFDVVSWTDATVDWPSYTLVIVRTTWSYSDSPSAAARFCAWLRALSAARVRVLNPPPLLLWSAHKRYLLELAARGIPTIPSVLAAAAPASAPVLDLAALMRERGWREALLKPCIGGGSRACLRVAADGAAAGQAWLDSHTRGRGAPGAEAAEEEEEAAAEAEDFLVQPFLEDVARGELSVVLIEGAVSHVVVKTPRGGDFRTQAEHGATSALVPAAGHALSALAARAGALALRAIDAACACAGVRADALLFARVDFLVDGLGEPVLLELEAIEPCLFFAEGGRASADKLAAAIRARLAE